MDQAIIDLLRSRSGTKKLELNHANGTVSLVSETGELGEPLAIKPLPALYGTGTGLDSVEFKDDRFTPLLLCIEEAILDAYKAHPSSLTDGIVLSSLDRLCMSPEANLQNDPLGNIIQFAIRLTLSLNDFSRQDVRLCLRKVKQSAARHNKLAGTRGYLDFIKEQLGKQTG